MSMRDAGTRRAHASTLAGHEKTRAEPGLFAVELLAVADLGAHPAFLATDLSSARTATTTTHENLLKFPYPVMETLCSWKADILHAPEATTSDSPAFSEYCRLPRPIFQGTKYGSTSWTSASPKLVDSRKAEKSPSTEWKRMFTMIAAK
jgi:hypothetical protein